MHKILAAMSGGVDSAVACRLLQEMGYEVGGATMLLREGGEQEAADARRAAAQMDIPFHLFALQEAFAANVIADFQATYQSGRTPNPCVVCNQTMKFGLFLEKALELGYDGIATGHYARTEYEKTSGRTLLKLAADQTKDQTYMLYGLSQAQLAHTVFPLGGLSKAQVREKAQALGLELAHKQDSQDICFVPDGDYMGFLTARGMQPTPGHFRGLDGRDYGPHRGQECYTIGQRRGLALSCGSRVYVVGKRDGDVLIGPDAALYARRVFVERVNFISIAALHEPMRVTAKLRYTQHFAACTLQPAPCGAELVFDAPQRAVTPGQSAVFYDGDTVVGGGIICGSCTE